MTRNLTTLNLDPFLKNAIGVGEFMNSLSDRIEHANAGNYPPYNITVTEDDIYKVELAVAGFSENDLSITVENEELKVTGFQDSTETDEIQYLHKGIGSRSFERSFALTDHLEVKGAEMKNGILTITLEREIPEALKPKTIKIK